MSQQGEIEVGMSVSAAVPLEKGGSEVVEGEVVEVQPYGCPFIDPSWNHETIVIKDHETHKITNWRPEYVTILGD